MIKLNDCKLDFVNETELADLLGCSARSIRRRVIAHELPPPIMLGRLRMWAVESVKLHLLDRAEDARVQISRMGG